MWPNILLSGMRKLQFEGFAQRCEVLVSSLVSWVLTAAEIAGGRGWNGDGGRPPRIGGRYSHIL